jgi:hypothetical protein
VKGLWRGKRKARKHSEDLGPDKGDIKMDLMERGWEDVN